MPRTRFQDYSFLCPLLQLPYEVYFALVTAINRANPEERKERFVDWVLRDRPDILKDIFGKTLGVIAHRTRTKTISKMKRYWWESGNELICLQFFDPPVSISIFRGTRNNWRSWKILLEWDKQDRCYCFDADTQKEKEINHEEFCTLFHTLNAQ